MTKKKPLIAVCAALLATIVLETGWVSAQSAAGPRALPPSSPLLPQVEEGPEATVTFGGGSSVKAKTFNRASDPIVLEPNQQVDVSVQYSVVKATQLIAVIPLDGGIIPGSNKKFAIGLDGALRFKFQAGGQPGVYQVSLHEGKREIGICFRVLESN